VAIAEAVDEYNNMEPKPLSEQSTKSSGRPQRKDRKDVSQVSILRTALKLSRKTPLQDLSIVTVAKSMGVTPALIHYYIGGRDNLTSGVMNLFYRELLKKWPEAQGDWQADLRTGAKAIYDQFVLYGGVAAYVVSNSRFRIFQLNDGEGPDFGVNLLERFTGLVRSAGLSGERTGVYAHLMLEFIINTAHGTARHVFPAEHRQFLEDKTASLDTDAFPNIFFARRAPLSLSGDIAFEEGTSLYLLGIRSELEGHSR